MVASSMVFLLFFPFRIFNLCFDACLHVVVEMSSNYQPKHFNPCVELFDMILGVDLFILVIDVTTINEQMQVKN